MKNLLIIFTALFITALISGCVSNIINLASEHDDLQAKQFKPKLHELSRIYVYRDEATGVLLKHPVYIDDIKVGTIDHCSYVYTDLKAGEHKISTINKGVHTDYIKIATDPGKVYFIELELTIHGPNFVKRDDNKSKPSILNCPLAELEYKF